jgi:hypothetical protein
MDVPYRIAWKILQWIFSIVEDIALLTPLLSKNNIQSKILQINEKN